MNTIVNISIDDVCPHPIMGMDAVNRLSGLLDLYPKLKCSLFVPTRLKRYKYKEKDYPLENYPKFVDQLKSLPSENFEICYHGHFHGHKQNKSNNDEFRYLSALDTFDKLETSQIIFDSLGIKVKPVFRPPGFWLGADAFLGCKEFGIKTLALNNDIKYSACYLGEQLKYDRVIFIGRQPNNQRFFEIMFHAGRDQKDFFNNIAFHELKTKLSKLSPEFVFLGDENGQD